MHRVFVTRQIPKEGLEVLRNDKLKVETWDSENVIPRKDLLEKVKGAHGILCTISDNIDEELLNAAGPQLKVVSTMSAGMEHINVNLCKRKKIEVQNSGDVASDSAAEFTVTLVLLVARRLLEGMDAVVKGEWGLWKPMWICGFEMHGRTLGLYGFGRVGFGVARRLKPFNLAHIIFNDTGENQFARSIDAKLVSLEQLFKDSDILCVCCAATPQTKKSVNAKMLGLMKDSAILINTARGSIVDHEALDKALKAGRPHACALDVTEPEPLPPNHPLLKNPQCIVTPHLGTATVSCRANMAFQAATNLRIVLLGSH